jgi:HEAT repeat protein
MDIEDTLPSIIKILESGCDAFTGMKMLNYLDRLNSTKTIPAVSIGLTSNDPFMQMAAARILGNLGSEEAIPALLLQLSNPNYKVRYYVIEAILNIEVTSNNYYHRLIHNLFDSDDVVRLKAASELKNLSSVEEIPYLIVALEHQDKKVRHEAAQALGKLIFLSSIPHILNILKEDHAGMPMKEVLGNIRTTLESTATTLNQISKMLNVNTR